MAPRPDEGGSSVEPSQVSLKTAFTVCFAVVCVAALVLFVWKTLLSLTFLITASMLAVSLDHAVQFFQRKGLKRTLAITLTVLLLLLTLAGFFLLLVPPAVKQGKALVKDGPHLVENFRKTSVFTTLEERFQLEEKVEALGQNASKIVTGAVSPVLSVVSGLLSALAGAITILVMTIFLLIFGGPFVKAILAEARPERRERYTKMLSKMYASVGGYLGGLLLICSINATLTTTFLAITRMPFFLPLGIFAGTSSLVPYAGPVVMAVGVTLIALVTGGVWKAVATAIYFILYGQLEGNVLGPVIFRRTVHMNPLVTLLSILFLAELAGIAGAIIAVPAVAVMQIVVRELLENRREQLGMASSGKGVEQSPSA